MLWLALSVALAAPPDTGAAQEADSDTPSEEADSDTPSEEAEPETPPQEPSTEEPSTEEPSTEEPSTEEPTDEPAPEKPTLTPAQGPDSPFGESPRRPQSELNLDRARRAGEEGEVIVQDFIDELTKPVDDTEAVFEVVERRVDPAADPSANRATIDGDRLREAPEPSVLESLAREVPGLHATTRGVGFHGVGPGSSGGITMRGLGGSPNTQVLTVIDGAPEYQGVFGHPLPDLLNPALVQEINVTPGGDSVRYGGSAMAAVIRVDSRWRHKDGITLGMDSRIGAFQSLELRPSVLATQGQWDVAAAVNARTSEGQRQGAGGHLVATELAARRRFTGGGELQLRNRASHLTGADPGPIDRPSPEATFDQDRASLSISARSRRLNTVDARGVAWLSGGRQRFADGMLVSDGLIGGFGELDWRPSQAVRMTFGSWTDATFGDWSNRITGETAEVPFTAQTALYGQATANPYEWIILMAGLRAVGTSEETVFVPWKAGAYINMWPGSALRLRHASNYRMPSIAERYLPLPAANPDLEPERSATTEVALQQLVGGGQLRAAIWQTKGREIIRTFGVFPDVEIANIGLLQVRGIELQGSGRPTPWLDLHAGLSLQNVGDNTRQNPTRMANGTVRLHSRYNGVSLTSRYLGGLYTENFAEGPLPDVFVVDAQIRRRLPDLPAEVYLLGRNLTNRPNATLDGYPIPGAHLMVGITWTAEREGLIWDGDLDLPSLKPRASDP